MTTALAIAEQRVDLLDAFTQRASARAYLWFVGEYQLAEALDQLQHDAKRDGLIDRIGQDAFQRPKQPEQQTPQTTVEAIMYCVGERGLGALNEATNVERLSRCDPAARTQINKRIVTLIEKGMLP
jgi:hypothetical protein